MGEGGGRLRKCEPSDAVQKSANKAVTTYQSKLQN